MLNVLRVRFRSGAHSTRRICLELATGTDVSPAVDEVLVTESALLADRGCSELEKDLSAPDLA